MQKQYAIEKSTISEQTARLEAELDKQRNNQDIAYFTEMIRKFSNIRKLTPEILQHFVDYIDVHHAERRGGRYYQKVVIHFNCAGVVHLPDVSAPKIDIEPRKGVKVSYSPPQSA